MKTLRASLSFILLLYSIPTILSGLDIYRGDEPDLSSEWIIIGIYFVLSWLLIMVNILGINGMKKPRNINEGT